MNHEATAGPTETPEEKKQRQEQANRQIWKKVDMETIILKTTYRGINDKKERQYLHTRDTDMNQEKGKRQDRQIIQNDLEYADDAQLFIEKGTRGQMCERIGDYDIATETRQLNIQWGKVELLRRVRRKLREKLPPPFDRIRHNHTGTTIGKEISMTGNLNKAVKRRIAKAKITWKQVHF